MRTAVYTLVTLCVSGCMSFYDLQMQEYESLGYEISEIPKSMNYVWLGQDVYPAHLSANEFMDSLRTHNAKAHQRLSHYLVQIRSYGSYYLIKVYDRRSQEMIMYDYSCTDKLDGPLYRAADRSTYDINVIPKECKTD